MPNLNVLGQTSAGSLTTVVTMGTIPSGGDGQSSIGVPNIVPSTLIAWGVQTTIADTIFEADLQCNDQIDVQNAETNTFGASSLLGYFNKYTNVPFISSTRAIKFAQNTGAANAIGYTIDLVGRGSTPIVGSPVAPNQVSFQKTLSVDTAVTWNSAQALTPTIPLKSGVYAILGAHVSALTNYGVVRFSHADFQGCKPGFPVVDRTNTALANAVDDKDPLFQYPGFQFWFMGQLTGQPVCPTFSVTAAGTGLTVDVLTITADTPRIILNLTKVS